MVPYRFRVVILLCALTTLTYLDRITISLVGVRIQDDLRLTNTQFGYVLAAFSLAYAIFEIPSGMLGDRIGPKGIFIRIVFWWSFFTAVTGMVTGLMSLIAIRFLFGMGESGTYPNSILALSRWFPVKEMGRALSIVGIGSQIGSLIAPGIILTLAKLYGWRIPFYVNGAIGIFWIIACYFWFRNFPSDFKNISEKERLYIENNRRHNSQQHLVSLKVIFKNRSVYFLMLMYFCGQWAQYFFVAWMPVYLQKGRHFTESEMGQITSLLFLFGIPGFVIGGLVGDWLLKLKGLLFSRRFVGMFGLSMCGLLILATAITTNKAMVPVFLFGANFFFCFFVMISYAVCSDIGRNNSGTVTGAMNFFGQMGAFFLAIIFGKIVDATHDFNYPMFVLGFVCITGCLLWLGIDPRKQLQIK